MATSFASRIAELVANAKVNAGRVMAGTVAEAHTSMTEGSTLTGAPGVPVDLGVLKSSYQPKVTGWTGRITSTLVYAPPIEDGEVQAHQRSAHQRTSKWGKIHTVRAHAVRGYTYRQPYPHGGGPHSNALTRVNIQKIVDHVVEQVVR